MIDLLTRTKESLSRQYQEFSHCPILVSHCGQYLSLIGQYLSLIGQYLSLIGKYLSLIGQCSPDNGADVEDTVEAGDDGSP